jgi:hypothetical protein
MLSRFLPNPGMEPPPEEADFTSKVDLEWGMYGNDVIGDCVLATAAHTDMVRTANRGHLFVPSVDAVKKAYSDITGWDPKKTDASGNNPTDQGTDPEDALTYRRKYGIAGNRIGASGGINPQDQQRIKQVINLLECAEFSLALPYAAGDLTDWVLPAGQSPTDVWAAGTWGGHSVPAVKYDPDWLYFVSWGKIYRANWRFALTYAVRVDGVVAEDMLDITTGRAPSGLDIVGLKAALEWATA